MDSLTSNRLQVLEQSLIKKTAKQDAAFSDYFADVKRANGQPLNDKRNGHVTLNRWDKKENCLRNYEKEIEKTTNAIEREKSKISASAGAMESMPLPIVELVENKTLIQWRKYPDTFFVAGVDKARIQYKDGELSYRYLKEIPTKEQYAIFRNVYNDLRTSLGLNK